MTLPLIPQDKANHFVYGVVAYALALLFVSPLVALGITIVIGAAKEAWDANGRGCVELLDFLATAAGGAVGFYCTTI